MAGDVTFSNFDLLARSLDTNKDGYMNELQATESIKQRVDTNGDGKISRGELASAMKADMVEVNSGIIRESRGMNVYTKGLETLKNVNTIANNSISYTFTHDYRNYEGADRARVLQDSNREYAVAVRKMETSLRSIYDMTRGNRDSISSGVSSVAGNALSDVRFSQMIDFMSQILDSASGGSVYGDPFSSGRKNSVTDDPFSNGNSVTDDPFSNGNGGGIDTSGLEARNQNLRIAYETLNSALRNIRSNTNSLPDIRQASSGVNTSISNAFSNINQIKSSTQSPTEVKAKLYKLSEDQMAQVTGRAAPYAGVGAGVGAVAGGTIGFFAGGRTTKSALIGAGIGTAVSAGIGALIGNAKDKSHERKANELTKLGDEIANYNPAGDEQSLESESLSSYNTLLNARNKDDIDNAIVITNNFKSIQSRVNPVEERTARILSGYKMK